jgi:hypothetical protein
MSFCTKCVHILFLVENIPPILIFKFREVKSQIVMNWFPNVYNWLENIFEGKCNNVFNAKTKLKVLHFAIGVHKRK